MTVTLLSLLGRHAIVCGGMTSPLGRSALFVVCVTNLILFAFWTQYLIVATWSGTVMNLMCLQNYQLVFFVLRDLLLSRDNQVLSPIWNWRNCHCYQLYMYQMISWCCMWFSAFYALYLCSFASVSIRGECSMLNPYFSLVSCYFLFYAYLVYDFIIG